MKADRFQISGFFSPVLKEFIMLEIGIDNMVYKDENDNVMSAFAAQKNLPFIFAGNIEKWGGFPIETDDGLITYEFAANSLRTAKAIPSDVLAQKLPLHILYESAPLGISLEIPPDILSIKADRLVFINCANGTVNEEKSKSFTEALNSAGVIFPIQNAAVNPSILKPFDEGMFFIDSANRLFQLKITEGSPFIKDMNISINEKVLYMEVDENFKKIFYGIIVTENSIYLNMYESGLQKLPLTDYNPKTDVITGRFTPFYQTITKRDLSVVNSPMQFAAADKNFDIVRKHERYLPQSIIKKRDYIAYGLSFLAPFYLTQFSYYSNEVLFKIAPAPHLIFAFLGIVFAQILYFCIAFGTKRKLDPFAIFAICFTGFFGLIASLIFSPIKGRS
jgi:hypothetical protein